MSTQSQVPALSRAPALIDTLRREFEHPSILAQLELALPPQIPARRFVGVVVMAVRQAPDLLNADRASLFKAALKAATDGLLPDGREAALVKFGTEVQYLPMVAGRLKKVRNSGQLKAIDAQLVYEADEFSYWIAEDGPHMKHVPDLAFEGRGEKVQCRLVYAVAQTHDGGTYLETMTVPEVERARAVSRAKDGPMWRNWWGEGARKSVLNRLSKRLPMSTDVAAWLDREPGEDEADVSDDGVEHRAREASVKAQFRRQDATKAAVEREAQERFAAPAEAPAEESGPVGSDTPATSPPAPAQGALPGTQPRRAGP